MDFPFSKRTLQDLAQYQNVTKFIESIKDMNSTLVLGKNMHNQFLIFYQQTINIVHKQNMTM